MISYIDRSEFINQMTKKGYGFSETGADALYDYLTELERDCGSDIKYDAVGLRCSFSEWEVEDLEENFYIFDDEYMEELEEDEKREYMLETLEEHTTVIYTEDTDIVIILDF